jgi:hypothetical protein
LQRCKSSPFKIEHFCQDWIHILGDFTKKKLLGVQRCHKPLRFKGNNCLGEKNSYSSNVSYGAKNVRNFNSNVNPMCFEPIPEILAIV